MLVLFVLLCIYVWRHRNESLVLYRTLGWITLGSYTLVTCWRDDAGTARARHGHGPFLSIWNIHGSLDCGVGLSCSH